MTKKEIKFNLPKVESKNRQHIEHIAQDYPNTHINELQRLSKEPKDMMSIRLPHSIFKQFQQEATRQGLSYNGLIIRLLRNEVVDIPENLETFDPRRKL